MGVVGIETGTYSWDWGMGVVGIETGTYSWDWVWR